MKVFLLICGLLHVALLKRCSIPSSAHNLALYGKVCHSSTLDSSPPAKAEYAVDGISETDPTRFPCSMTNLEWEPYLTVEMEESQPIGFVIVINRQDRNYKYMENATLQIGDSPERDNPTCANITGLHQSQPQLKFFCKGMVGRYVTLVQKDKFGFVSCCEIKVYPHQPEAGETMGWF